MLAALVTPQVVFNGLVQGLVYGAARDGDRARLPIDRVINFAVGNMGLVGAGLLVLLDRQLRRARSGCRSARRPRRRHGVRSGHRARRGPPAVRGPRVIVLVATIGVAQLSAAILIAYPDIDNARAGYPLPFEREFSIGDLRIKPALLAVIVVVPLVALALGWFLNNLSVDGNGTELLLHAHDHVGAILS